jgi:peroxiredoxin
MPSNLARGRARRAVDTIAAHRAWRWAERLLWVALLVYLGMPIWPQIAAAGGIASASAETPAFELATLDGSAISSKSLAGKVVLLNFWATWCPPCRVEMPGFQRIYEQFRNDGFVVLGVSMDAGGSEDVRRFLDERDITYPVAIATPAIVRDFGGVRLLPTSYLIIDRKGRIRNEVSGLFTSVALAQAIDRLVRESAPSLEGRITP